MPSLDPAELWQRGTALLVLDVINDMDFPGGDALARRAMHIIEPLLALRRRFDEAGAPVIYCNDNMGHWHADFEQVIERCSAPGRAGAALCRALRPRPRDYFVLKPKHSAFYASALPPLLGHLEVRRLVITGLAADACVLSTASDAHIREWPLWVPVDCTAAISRARHSLAVRLLKDSLLLDTTPALRRLAAPST